MAKPTLNLENSIQAKSNQKPPKTAKNTFCISASLFFIFICVSLFRFFSPSTLFNDIKFWFFISNAIIIILAADSGAFSSSKQKQDIYEEFLINSRSRSPASLITESPQNSSIFVSEAAIETVLEKKPESETSIRSKSGIQCETISKDLPRLDIGKEGDRESCRDEAICHRSNSEKTISVVGYKKEKILRRSETEKLGVRSKLEDKENELSAMSVDELNRKFEEFIQRFNREIRLQETRSFDEKLENEET